MPGGPGAFPLAICKVAAMAIVIVDGVAIAFVIDVETDASTFHLLLSFYFVFRLSCSMILCANIIGSTL